MHNVKKDIYKFIWKLYTVFSPIIEMHDTHDRIKARNGTNR